MISNLCLRHRFMPVAFHLESDCDCKSSRKPITRSSAACLRIMSLPLTLPLLMPPLLPLLAPAPDMLQGPQALSMVAQPAPIRLPHPDMFRAGCPVRPQNLPGSA